MKVRKIDAKGASLFGRGRNDYLENSPEAVAQCVMTRLALKTGEWFTDTADGTPYAERILGEHTKHLYDLTIRKRILETEGVAGIESYTSSLDADTRKLKVEARITTVYGSASLNQEV